ncbi:MAG: hypothetical protein ACW97A_03785 [Candidatus Thorarchaeota archaeon]|jgi:predicted  nucleic acid-binding Zn-ribbon protein
MIFKCRNCSATSADIDMVLDSACSCGSAHFQLVSEENPTLPTAITMKEEVRRDLHRWLDLNIDSMDSEAVGNLRVVFECDSDDSLNG